MTPLSSSWTFLLLPASVSSWLRVEPPGMEHGPCVHSQSPFPLMTSEPSEMVLVPGLYLWLWPGTLQETGIEVGEDPAVSDSCAGTLRTSSMTVGQ